MKDANSDKVKKVCQGIQKGFRDVNLFALPGPGDAVISASEHLTFGGKFVHFFFLLFSQFC